MRRKIAEHKAKIAKVQPRGFFQNLFQDTSFSRSRGSTKVKRFTGGSALPTRRGFERTFGGNGSGGVIADPFSNLAGQPVIGDLSGFANPFGERKKKSLY